jgi:prepilin-type processing-associated H-X9-DG protein
MYCPKCGTENPDGAEICRNCSRVITNLGLTTSLPQSRTSPLAIASLILGLLSFCTMFLTAPLAIILGIIALVMIARSHGQLKGIGFAIVGILVPILVFILIMIWSVINFPEIKKTHHRVLQQACTYNLQRLGASAKSYADDNNGQYPPADKWCDLLQPYYKEETILACPSVKDLHRFDGEAAGKCHYAMNVNAKRNSPSNMVLLFETNPGWNQCGGPELLKTDNHFEKGSNILFNDGHVEFVRIEDINSLRWIVKQ